MRYLLAAFPAVLILSAACGGGSGGKSPTVAGTAGPTLTAKQARQTTTAKALEQPTAVDVPLATPTVLPEDGIIIQVAGAAAPYAPKLSEYKTLPTIEIKAGGKTYSGVSLATLAEKSKAATGVAATIEGVRLDGKRRGIIRFPLADVATNTVLVLAAHGQLALASSSIPPDQWLNSVTSVAFR